MVKNPPASAGDIGDVQSPGGGDGNPFQYSCPETHDRGAWRASVHGVTESDMTERLKTHALSLIWSAVYS